jgi:hypothetical protein
MIDASEVNAEIKRRGMAPIFTDGVMVGLRLRTKTKSGISSKEPVDPSNLDIVGGLIEMVFVDNSKQQPLGVFIFDRQTAEELRNALNETITKFDEFLRSKDLSRLMPKHGEERGEQQSYR